MPMAPCKNDDFDDDDDFLVEALENIEDTNGNEMINSIPLNNICSKIPSSSSITPALQSCPIYEEKNFVHNSLNESKNSCSLERDLSGNCCRINRSDIDTEKLNENMGTAKSRIISNAAQNLFKSPVYNSPIIRKRKFPGPAGLLPSWGSKSPHTKITSIRDLHEVNNDEAFSMEESMLYSQMSAEEFNSGPWSKMIQDFGFVENDPNCPLHVFNIRNLRNPTHRELGGSGLKMEFLAVIILSVEYGSGITANFKDKTGEIGGTITSSVIEKYGSFITTGSILILKDVSVLSPITSKIDFSRGLPKLSYYLTITLNSIASIYSVSDDGAIVVTKLISLSSQNIKELLGQRSSRIRTVVEESETVVNLGIGSSCLFENISSKESESLSKRPALFSSTNAGKNFKPPNKFSSSQSARSPVGRAGVNVNTARNNPSSSLQSPSGVNVNTALNNPSSRLQSPLYNFNPINNANKDSIKNKVISNNPACKVQSPVKNFSPVTPLINTNNKSISKSFSFKSTIKRVENPSQDIKSVSPLLSKVKSSNNSNIKENVNILKGDLKRVNENANFDMFDDGDDALFDNIDIDSFV